MGFLNKIGDVLHRGITKLNTGISNTANTIAKKTGSTGLEDFSRTLVGKQPVSTLKKQVKQMRTADETQKSYDTISKLVQGNDQQDFIMNNLNGLFSDNPDVIKQIKQSGLNKTFSLDTQKEIANSAYKNISNKANEGYNDLSPAERSYFTNQQDYALRNMASYLKTTQGDNFPKYIKEHPELDKYFAKQALIQGGGGNKNTVGTYAAGFVRNLLEPTDEYATLLRSAGKTDEEKRTIANSMANKYGYILDEDSKNPIGNLYGQYMLHGGWMDTMPLLGNALGTARTLKRGGKLTDDLKNIVIDKGFDKTAFVDSLKNKKGLSRYLSNEHGIKIDQGNINKIIEVAGENQAFGTDIINSVNDTIKVSPHSFSLLGNKLYEGDKLKKELQADIRLKSTGGSKSAYLGKQLKTIPAELSSLDKGSMKFLIGSNAVATVSTAFAGDNGVAQIALDPVGTLVQTVKHLAGTDISPDGIAYNIVAQQYQNTYNGIPEKGTALYNRFIDTVKEQHKYLSPGEKLGFQPESRFGKILMGIAEGASQMLVTKLGLGSINKAGSTIGKWTGIKMSNIKFVDNEGNFNIKKLADVDKIIDPQEKSIAIGNLIKSVHDNKVKLSVIDRLKISNMIDKSYTSLRDTIDSVNISGDGYNREFNKVITELKSIDYSTEEGGKLMVEKIHELTNIIGDLTKDRNSIIMNTPELGNINKYVDRINMGVDLLMEYKGKAGRLTGLGNSIVKQTGGSRRSPHAILDDKMGGLIAMQYKDLAAQAKSEAKKITELSALGNDYLTTISSMSLTKDGDSMRGLIDRTVNEKLAGIPSSTRKLIKDRHMAEIRQFVFSMSVKDRSLKENKTRNDQTIIKSVINSIDKLFGNNKIELLNSLNNNIKKYMGELTKEEIKKSGFTKEILLSKIISQKAMDLLDKYDPTSEVLNKFLKSNLLNGIKNNTIKSLLTNNYKGRILLEVIVGKGINKNIKKFSEPLKNFFKYFYKVDGTLKDEATIDLLQDTLSRVLSGKLDSILKDGTLLKNLNSIGITDKVIKTMLSPLVDKIKSYIRSGYDLELFSSLLKNKIANKEFSGNDLYRFITELPNRTVRDIAQELLNVHGKFRAGIKEGFDNIVKKNLESFTKLGKGLLKKIDDSKIGKVIPKEFKDQGIDKLNNFINDSIKDITDIDINNIIDKELINENLYQANIGKEIEQYAYLSNLGYEADLFNKAKESNIVILKDFLTGLDGEGLNNIIGQLDGYVKDPNNELSNDQFNNAKSTLSKLKQSVKSHGFLDMHHDEVLKILESMINMTKHYDKKDSVIKTKVNNTIDNFKNFVDGIVEKINVDKNDIVENLHKNWKEIYDRNSNSYKYFNDMETDVSHNNEIDGRNADAMINKLIKNFFVKGLAMASDGTNGKNVLYNSINKLFGEGAINKNINLLNVEGELPLDQKSLMDLVDKSTKDSTSLNDIENNFINGFMDNLLKMVINRGHYIKGQGKSLIDLIKNNDIDYKMADDMSAIEYHLKRLLYYRSDNFFGKTIDENARTLIVKGQVDGNAGKVITFKEHTESIGQTYMEKYGKVSPFESNLGLGEGAIKFIQSEKSIKPIVTLDDLKQEGNKADISDMAKIMLGKPSDSDIRRVMYRKMYTWLSKIEKETGSYVMQFAGQGTKSLSIDKGVAQTDFNTFLINNFKGEGDINVIRQKADKAAYEAVVRLHLYMKGNGIYGDSAYQINPIKMIDYYKQVLNGTVSLSDFQMQYAGLSMNSHKYMSKTNTTTLNVTKEDVKDLYNGEGEDPSFEIVLLKDPNAEIDGVKYKSETLDSMKMDLGKYAEMQARLSYYGDPKNVDSYKTNEVGGGFIVKSHSTKGDAGTLASNLVGGSLVNLKRISDVIMNKSEKFSNKKLTKELEQYNKKIKNAIDMQPDKVNEILLKHYDTLKGILSEAISKGYLKSVAYDSALKDFTKGKNGFTLNKIGSPSYKGNGIEKGYVLPIKNVNVYGISDAIERSNLAGEKQSAINQMNQNLDYTTSNLINTAYNKVSENDRKALRIIFDNLKAGRYIEANSLVQKQFGITMDLNSEITSGVLSQGFQSISAPNIGRFMFKLIKEHVYKRSLPGRNAIMKGMPSYIFKFMQDRLNNKGFNISNDNHRIVITSRINVGDYTKDSKKDDINVSHEGYDNVRNKIIGLSKSKWNEGDALQITRHPNSGIKSNLAVKTIFIEDLLNDNSVPDYIKDYFSTDGIAHNSMYYFGKVIDDLEGDFDGDTTVAFSEMSKHVAEDGRTIGDILYDKALEMDPYANESPTKSTIDDMVTALGKESVVKYGGLLGGMLMSNTKTNVGSASMYGRVLGTLKRAPFFSMREGESLEDFSNRNTDEHHRYNPEIAAIINAAVDGQLTDKQETTFRLIYGYGKEGEGILGSLPGFNSILNKLHGGIDKKTGKIDTEDSNNKLFVDAMKYYLDIVSWNTGSGMNAFLSKKNDKGMTKDLNDGILDNKKGIFGLDSMLTLKLVDSNIIKTFEKNENISRSDVIGIIGGSVKEVFGNRIAEIINDKSYDINPPHRKILTEFLGQLNEANTINDIKNVVSELESNMATKGNLWDIPYGFFIGKDGSPLLDGFIKHDESFTVLKKIDEDEVTARYDAMQKDVGLRGNNFKKFAMRTDNNGLTKSRMEFAKINSNMFISFMELEEPLKEVFKKNAYEFKTIFNEKNVQVQNKNGGYNRLINILKILKKDNPEGAKALASYILSYYGKEDIPNELKIMLRRGIFSKVNAAYDSFLKAHTNNKSQYKIINGMKDNKYSGLNSNDKARIIAAKFQGNKEYNNTLKKVRNETIDSKLKNTFISDKDIFGSTYKDTELNFLNKLYKDKVLDNEFTIEGGDKAEYIQKIFKKTIGIILADVKKARDEMKINPESSISNKTFAMLNALSTLNEGTTYTEAYSMFSSPLKRIFKEDDPNLNSSFISLIVKHTANFMKDVMLQAAAKETLSANRIVKMFDNIGKPDIEKKGQIEKSSIKLSKLIGDKTRLDGRTSLINNVHKAKQEVVKTIMDSSSYKKQMINMIGKIMGKDPKITGTEAMHEAFKEITIKGQTDLSSFDTATQNKLKIIFNEMMQKTSTTISNHMDKIQAVAGEMSKLGGGMEDTKKYRDKKIDGDMINLALKTQGEGEMFVNGLMNSMNNIYKSTSLGLAAGRIFIETFNAMTVNTINKFNSNKVTSEKGLIKQLELRKGEKLNINKGGLFKRIIRSHRSEFSKKIFKLSNTQLDSSGAITERITKMLNAAGEKIGNSTYEATTKFFRDRFLPAEVYNRLSKAHAEADRIGKQRISRLLTANDLTKRESISKSNLLNKIVREAVDETKTNFFDYTDNPLWAANIEQYVPFFNFSYNNIKMLLANPLGWLSTFQMLNTMQTSMQGVEYMLDEDEFKGYFHKNGIGGKLLGLIGFGTMGLDMQRLSPITMALSIRGYPYQKLLYPTQDYYYGKYLDGEISFPMYILKRTMPAIADIIDGDPKSTYQRMFFQSSGIPMRDNSLKEFMGAYYNGDYDKVLGYNNNVLGQYNKWRKSYYGKDTPDITRDTIKALAKMDKIMGRTDDKDADYYRMKSFPDLVEVTYGLHDLQRTDINSYQKYKMSMENIYSQYVEGFKDSNFDINDYLSKIKQLKSSGVLNELGKANIMSSLIDKMLFKADNINVLKTYYYGTFDNMKSDDLDIKEDAIAKNLAFRTKFIGEDSVLLNPGEKLKQGQSIEDYLSSDKYLKRKTYAIKQGLLTTPVQLDTVALINDNKNMTKLYQKYLVTNKGELINQLNGAMAEIDGYDKMIWYWKLEAKDQKAKGQKDNVRYIYDNIIGPMEKKKVSRVVETEQLDPLRYDLALKLNKTKGLDLTKEGLMSSMYNAKSNSTKNWYNNSTNYSKAKEDYYKNSIKRKSYAETQQYYTKYGFTLKDIKGMYEENSKIHSNQTSSSLDLNLSI